MMFQEIVSKVVVEEAANGTSNVAAIADEIKEDYPQEYGAYADKPTSIDPIGIELKELRQRSASLKDFLDTVAVMTSRQELKEALEGGDLKE